MRFLFEKNIFSILICFTLFSCSNSNEAGKENEKQDTVKKVSPEFKNVLDFGSKEGIAGVFYIPEMLTLCVSDSSDIKDLGPKLEADYSGLQAELNNIGAESNGPLGQIKYNNDPKNFKFECIALIRKIPAKQPTYGKIVVLEAMQALVYNYYGPYETLYLGYNGIREYMNTHKLESSGPMREFYVTMPGKDVDPKTCLTRIMLPVKGKGTK